MKHKPAFPGEILKSYLKKHKHILFIRCSKQTQFNFNELSELNLKCKIHLRFRNYKIYIILLEVYSEEELVSKRIIDWADSRLLTHLILLNLEEYLSNYFNFYFKKFEISSAQYVF